MPIFEYRCRACGARFEELVRAADAPAPACARCGAADTTRELSVFAVGKGGAPAPAAVGGGACGMCGDPRGPGACSLG